MSTTPDIVTDGLKIFKSNNSGDEPGIGIWIGVLPILTAKVSHFKPHSELVHCTPYLSNGL